MKFKQMISLLLTVSIITLFCLTAVSCSGSDPDDGSVESSSASEETIAAADSVDSLTARRNVSDNVETEDFDGRIFHIIGDASYTEWYTREEMTGDILEDAIFQRNLDIT